MDKSTKGLIKYFGLAKNLPKNPYAFKQVNVHERLYLSNDMPNFDKLVSVVASTDVVEVRVIQTPKATSFDGIVLTGWGLIAKSHLELKIEYISSLDNHSVEIAYFHLPFNTFLVLPEHFKTTSSIKVTGYIEDISAKLIDEKQLFLDAFILMDALIYR